MSSFAWRRIRCVEAAQRDPGSTRSKPIEFEIEGVHVVAYRRACFVLRRDAVRRMRRGSWLLVWAKERTDRRWRVYAFDHAALEAALSTQMAQPSYADRGWYGFTKIPQRLDVHLVPRHA